jgi:aspartyl-tRNA(Asn)/glutamyl-tRNA(Gln) amidotransferase subunit B
MDNQYDLIVGLEIHIQNKTNSKMFCGCSTKYFQKEENTHVCPVCLGLPGALPVPNKRALELTILLGLATNCDIDREVRFDRKHYFYPDLPKGYQISQYDQPVCSDGYLETFVEGELMRFDIERIHQEEDVAKSTHHEDSDGEYSLIDYNKSGVPLIEIVTRPVIRSAKEAKAFASEIRRIVRALNISDADIEKGQMRCEPNVSLQKKGTWEYVDGEIRAIGEAKLNPKVEIKNIGSISAVEKSIEFEYNRLLSDIENGKEIIQQTRGWDPNNGITVFQRSKETAEDYRYFPEPDIPIIEISEEDIERLGKELRVLPIEKESEYLERGLSPKEAKLYSSDTELRKLLKDGEKIVKKENLRSFVNTAASTALAYSNEVGKPLHELNITGATVAHIDNFIRSGNSNSNKVIEISLNSFRENKDPIKELENSSIEVISDLSALEDIARKVIEDNPKAVEEYRSGKEAAIQFLVGMMMRESMGNADPNSSKDILIRLLK